MRFGYYWFCVVALSCFYIFTPHFPILAFSQTFCTHTQTQKTIIEQISKLWTKKITSNRLLVSPSTSSTHHFQVWYTFCCFLFYLQRVEWCDSFIQYILYDFKCYVLSIFGIHFNAFQKHSNKKKPTKIEIENIEEWTKK